MAPEITKKFLYSGGSPKKEKGTPLCGVIPSKGQSKLKGKDQEDLREKELLLETGKGNRKEPI